MITYDRAATLCKPDGRDAMRIAGARCDLEKLKEVDTHGGSITTVCARDVTLDVVVPQARMGEQVRVRGAKLAIAQAVIQGLSRWMNRASWGLSVFLMRTMAYVELVFHYPEYTRGDA